MGAWDNGGYKKGMGDKNGVGQVAYAVRAIKEELDALGYGPFTDGGHFGKLLDGASRKFQDRHGLVVDGIVGPATCSKLWLQHVSEVEHKYQIPQLHMRDGIPCGFVLGTICHESSYDPGAIGSDPDDHGICQINAGANPTVTLAEAYSPHFAILFLASTMKRQYDLYSKTATSDVSWSAAIAFWNSHVDANKWAETGQPPDAQIEHYVSEVKSLCGQP